jgi:hypothetical protein
MDVRSPQSAVIRGLASAALMLTCCAAGPATAPADAYSTLIHQLGDEDYNVREAASAQLLAAGDEAKSALEVAARDSDPEISSRARSLLNRLTVLPFPQEAPPGVDVPQGLSFGSHISGDTRVTDLRVNGRTTHIEQGPDGVKMTVTGYVNGQLVTHEYRAADADALKAQSPQAFALWEQMGSGDGQMHLPGGLTITGGTVIIGPPMQPAAQVDNIDKLTQDIVRQMQMTKVTDEQRNQVLEQLQQVRMAKAALAANPGDEDKNQTAYLKACDDLRKQMAVAGLPDAGPELPPPASVRLGISIGPDGSLLGGVQIVSVQPDSRGEKIGLQKGDVILSVNGKPVTSTLDLRKLVMESKHLTLSVSRGGAGITLTEPAAQ